MFCAVYARDRAGTRPRLEFVTSTFQHKCRYVLNKVNCVDVVLKCNNIITGGSRGAE